MTIYINMLYNPPIHWIKVLQIMSTKSFCNTSPITLKPVVVNILILSKYKLLKLTPMFDDKKGMLNINGNKNHAENKVNIRELLDLEN